MIFHRISNSYPFTGVQLEAINVFILLRNQVQGIEISAVLNEFEVEAEGLEVARSLLELKGEDSTTCTQQLSKLDEQIEAMLAVREEFGLLDEAVTANCVIYLALCEVTDYLEAELGETFVAYYDQLVGIIDEGRTVCE